MRRDPKRKARLPRSAAAPVTWIRLGSVRRSRSRQNKMISKMISRMRPPIPIYIASLPSLWRCTC